MHHWIARPVIARSIRVASILLPLAASVLIIRLVAEALPRPVGVFWSTVWLFGLTAASIAAFSFVDRVARRSLPLSMLFRLSLVFPDAAPSRFGVALRSGSTSELKEGLRNGTSAAPAADLLALVARVSSHDRLTRGHSERVRAYATMIGEQMGIDPRELEKLQWAALVHDVGKLSVPSEILNKPGPPTPEEWQVLRAHPASSTELLDPLRPWLGDWLLAATQHHERFDGKGYPRGLSGFEISLAGRIVAVADAYDVMTSTRSYKKSFTPTQARDELSQNAGSQFDPGVVRAFLNIGLDRVTPAWGPLAWLPELPTGQVGMVGARALGASVFAAAGLVGGLPFASGADGESAAAAVWDEFEFSTPVTGVPWTEATGADPDADPASVGDDGATVESGVRSRTSPTTRRGGSGSGQSTGTTVAGASGQRSSPDGGSGGGVWPPGGGGSSGGPNHPGPTVTTRPPTTHPATTDPPSPTTTTTAPPSELYVLHLLNPGSGNTSSSTPLSLSPATPGGSWLPNYDTNRNDDPGLTIKKDGNGLSGSDPTKYQDWLVTTPSTMKIDGWVSLELWVAAEDFNDDKRVGVKVVISDCAQTCSTIASDTSTVRTDEWARLTLEFGHIERDLAAGHSLRIRVVAPDSISEDDVWIAYDTASFRSRIIVK